MVAVYWERFTKIILKVIIKILLIFVFYIILFPLAQLSGIFGGSKMIIKKKRQDTYYMDRNHIYTAEDMENTW